MGTDGFYMPPIGEPASRGQQPGRPMSCMQGLHFGGAYDQETPPCDTAGPQPNLTVIISPTTLHKVSEEQLGRSTNPVEAAKKPKKGRKHSRSKKASSQPLPKKILRARDSVRQEPSDFRVHIVGKTILTKDMLEVTGGPIENMNYSIPHLETTLLKEKKPGYPVFTCKVPLGHGFVDQAPTDIFFVWYKDIYNLLHSKRLDYNLVHLYSLNMGLKAKREKTKGIMIVDPYYMHEVVLANDGDRAMVAKYLGNIFHENQTIDSILLPCFLE